MTSGQAGLHSSEMVLPAFVLFSSQPGVVTFDALWLPGHRVALNLQLGVSRQRFEAKAKGWRGEEGHRGRVVKTAQMSWSRVPVWLPLVSKATGSENSPAALLFRARTRTTTKSESNLRPETFSK